MSLAGAQKYLNKGQFGEAREVLRAGERGSKDPRRLLVLARIYEAEGDVARAEAELQALVDQYPEFAPGHLFRGIAAFDAGDFEMAGGRFQRVIELQPYNDLAHSYLALTHLAAGRDEAGVEIFRKRGFNDNRWFMVRLAEWVEMQWLEHGRYFASVEVAVDEAPVKDGFFGRRKREGPAQKFFFAKQYREMLGELTPLTAEQHPDEEVLFACAIGCEMLGDYGKALDYLARISPEDVPPDAALAATARCKIRLGQFAEAAEIMNKVLMIGPEDYGMNYYLGVLCLAHGERQRGLQFLYRAFSDYLVDTLEYQFWQLEQAVVVRGREGSI